MTTLIPVEQAAALIRSGAPLTIAAEEALLRQLPKGNWIGGTIPYFMLNAGSCKNKNMLLVQELGGWGSVRFQHYTVQGMSSLMRDAPSNGWTLVVMPYGGQAHEKFASNCRDDRDAFIKPVAGWVSGVDLDLLGKATPKIVMGPTGEVFEDGVVAAHGTLPDAKLAIIEIVNIFEPDRLDVVRFPKTGFKASDCTVNGTPSNIVSFMQSRGNADGKLPLVGDFEGTFGNAAIQSMDKASGVASFYAPVFPDVEYFVAKPVGNYAEAFRSRLATLDHTSVLFACNCAVNYVHGELERQSLGPVEGPITFGEIGYQLLSQTLVALRIV